MTSNVWCGYCGSTIAGMHLVIDGHRCHAMYDDSEVDRLQAEVARLRALLAEALSEHDESMALVKRVVGAERDDNYSVPERAWAKQVRAALGEGRP
jgi:hypothetical protein